MNNLTGAGGPVRPAIGRFMPVSEGESDLERMGSAPTSGYLWALLVAAGGALVTLQVPRVMDRLVRDVPEDIRSDVGSPEILRLALGVGAYASVAVYLLVMVFYCLVGRGLESRSGIAPVHTWRALRIGPIWAGLAAATVPFHTVGLITGESLPKGSTFHLIYLCVCCAITVALCLRAVAASSQMRWKPWIPVCSGVALVLMTGLI